MLMSVLLMLNRLMLLLLVLMLLLLLRTRWYDNRRRNLPDGTRGLGDPPAHRLAVEARQPC